MTYLQSNRGTVTTGFQLTFKRTHKIADFFVVDIEVAVSGYPKLVAPVDRKSRK